MWVINGRVKAVIEPLQREVAVSLAKAVGRNDDNRVSTTHWRFSILRRMGKPDEARKVLDAITSDMNVIENTSYHRLCLFYKGELSVEDVLPETDGDPANSAIAYGVANWFYTEGNTARAREILEDLVASSGWSAFGVIAAEADLDRVAAVRLLDETAGDE